MPSSGDFLVTQLGEPRFVSPLARWVSTHGAPIRFISDSTRIPLEIEVVPGRSYQPDHSFEKAGPRERIFFDPTSTRVAIVTCGGLCPGINNVIRSIVMQLYHGYGVEDVLGIRYGYKGLDPANSLHPIPLRTANVADLHRLGGTLLGTSRGPVDMESMVRYLRANRINILFTIGGDGTQRGAHHLHKEAARQGYPLSVVGIPKTIDNDIPYVWRSFGYESALEKSREIIECAHNEAIGQINGIGLVKLMGREAGFVAAGATLASGDVNFCLIPEIPFQLDGDSGLLAHLRKRIEQRGHAVIVVAEGAGQNLFPADAARLDASGNVKFHDIGAHLVARIRQFFQACNQPVELKYFDPSYYIRSAPANTGDSLFCDQLARNAVHAAMAGKTGLVIGIWYNVMTHVPISMIAGAKKRVSEDGEIWQAVLKVTGQPPRFQSRVPEPVK